MSKCSFILRVSGIAAATVLSGVFLGRLASQVRQTSVQVRHSPNSVFSEMRTSAQLPASPVVSDNDQRSKVIIEHAATIELTNWNETVAGILSSGSDEKEKNQQLLELLPRLPPEGQSQVAEHLSRSLPNQDFPQLGQYLTNATTPEPVLDVIMADLLNRPDTLKLPYLLQIARDQQSPKAAEAKGILAALLDEDFGDNWPQWQAKVDQWVKDYSD